MTLLRLTLGTLGSKKKCHLIFRIANNQAISNRKSNVIKRQSDIRQDRVKYYVNLWDCSDDPLVLPEDHLTNYIGPHIPTTMTY